MRVGDVTGEREMMRARWAVVIVAVCLMAP